MNSRYKPVGWKNDNYRHYLAAKYGSAGGRRYRMTKERAEQISGFMHSMFDDGRADVGDIHAMHKRRVADDMFQTYSRKFSEAEGTGKLRPGACESFMKDDLTNETKDFVDNKTDEAQYRQNLDRRAHKHMQQYSVSFKMFGAPEEAHHTQKFKVFDVGEEGDEGKTNVFFARKHRHLWYDKLPGGLADDKKPSQFNQKELMRGMRHEMEHTNNKEIAMEIAMDHLTEDKDYYKNLDKFEKGMM